MTITDVDHVKQIPSCALRGYSLSASYTEQDAARDFEAYYHAEPVMAWRWASYLYIELPHD